MTEVTTELVPHPDGGTCFEMTKGEEVQLSAVIPDYALLPENAHILETLRRGMVNLHFGDQG